MPESQPNISEKASIMDTRLSRRDILKRGAAVIAATAIPELAPNRTKAADITTLSSEIPLTPEGQSIDRNGWSFSTNIDRFAPSTAGGNRITLEFQGGYLTPDPAFVFENGSLDKTQSKRTTEISINGTKSAVTDIYPSPDGDQITITYKELGKDGNVIREEELPVTLEFATYDPEDPNDTRRVWSETPLGQDLLRKIHESAQPFDVFRGKKYPTFIVVPNGRVNFPITNHEDEYIQYPVNFLDNPELLKESLVLLDHERFHSIHTPATLSTPEAIEADRKLEEKHEQFWFEKTGVTNGFGFMPPEIVGHPAMKLIDESENYPETRKIDKRDAGVPYSNHREYFASAMNMFVRKGGEIIEKVEALHDPKERQETIEFFRNVLSLGKALAEDEQKLLDTFPELAKVNDYVSSIEPQAPTPSQD